MAQRSPYARRGQQAIDHLFVGIGRFVGEECRNLFGRRRQAGQIEGQAANQRGAVGFLRRIDACFFHFGENQGIDGIANPVFVHTAGTAGRTGVKMPTVCRFGVGPVVGAGVWLQTIATRVQAAKVASPPSSAVRITVSR